MKVVILGCGRVGARLAQLMEAEGHSVSIIDSDHEAFNRLPETFKGETTLGTGIDADVLKAAGIEGADSFAAVTNYDNTNIMACQVAKEIFGVPHVLARIYDPGRESLYHELGLETVCPTTLVSTTVRDLLLNPHADDHLNGQSIGEAIAGAPTAAITPNNEGHTIIPSRHPAPDSAINEQKAQPNGHGLRTLFRH